MEDINKQAIISEHMRSIQKKRWADMTPEKRAAFREKCKEYGKKGADKRWGQPSSD